MREVTEIENEGYYGDMNISASVKNDELVNASSADEWEHYSEFESNFDNDSSDSDCTFSSMTTTNYF